MNVVYATATVALGTADGGHVVIRSGEHWPADDPIVTAHPDLFSADPRTGLSYSTTPQDPQEAPVETVTARPGEKRAMVRR